MCENEKWQDSIAQKEVCEPARLSTPTQTLCSLKPLATATSFELWNQVSTVKMNFICMRKKNYFHINGFSLSLALLVLSLASRGFSPGTPVFPSPQKPTLPNSNSIWDAQTRLNEFILTVTEACDNSEIAYCRRCFLLRTKTLPRTQQLRFPTVATMQEASLCTLAFLKIALPTF